LIYGIGIDLSDCTRFEKWLNDDHFCYKYYSDEEIVYFRSRGRGSVYSMAAGFAAKEAFGKALGTGLAGIRLKGITVLRDDKGRPYFQFDDTISKTIKSCGINPKVHLSLSHESHLAIAQVIIEVENV